MSLRAGVYHQAYLQQRESGIGVEFKVAVLPPAWVLGPTSFLCDG